MSITPFKLFAGFLRSRGGGGDINECVMASYRIKEGDDESWYREWLATAVQRGEAAEGFLAAGHRLILSSIKKRSFDPLSSQCLISGSLGSSW